MKILYCKICSFIPQTIFIKSDKDDGEIVIVIVKEINYKSEFLHSTYIGEKWEYKETVRQLFIDFKKPHDSVRRKYCIIFS
jgi:hypothetical protein